MRDRTLSISSHLASNSTNEGHNHSISVLALVIRSAEDCETWPPQCFLAISPGPGWSNLLGSHTRIPMCSTHEKKTCIAIMPQPQGMHQCFQHLLFRISESIGAGCIVVSNMLVVRVHQPVWQLTPLFHDVERSLHLCKPHSGFQWPLRQIPR